MPCSRKKPEITCSILLTRTQGLCGQYVMPGEKGRPQVKKKKANLHEPPDSKVSLPVLPPKLVSPLVSPCDTRRPWIGWMRWCPYQSVISTNSAVWSEACLWPGREATEREGSRQLTLEQATGGTGDWWITRFRRLANPGCQVFHVGRLCVCWHRETKAQRVFNFTALKVPFCYCKARWGWLCGYQQRVVFDGITGTFPSSVSLESEQCSPGVIKLIGHGWKVSPRHICSSTVSWKKASQLVWKALKLSCVCFLKLLL